MLILTTGLAGRGIMAGATRRASRGGGYSTAVNTAIAAVVSATEGEVAIRCQPRQTAVTVLTLAARTPQCHTKLSSPADVW